jgi:hypothetical protein
MARRGFADQILRPAKSHNSTGVYQQSRVKQISFNYPSMSAFGSKADITATERNFNLRLQQKVQRPSLARSRLLKVLFSRALHSRNSKAAGPMRSAATSPGPSDSG